MARILVPYDDFSGGDWGYHQAWNAPKGSFSAINMLVTKAGELTVRPGLKNVTPTGVPATALHSFGQFGDGDASVFFQDTSNNMYAFNPWSPTLTGARAMTGFIEDYDDMSDGQSAVAYAVTSSGGVYTITPAAATQLTGSPSGAAVALYRNRLVVAQFDNTLKWSDIDATTGAPNFNSWNALNTVSVGDSSAIVALRVIRDTLVVFKVRGVYVITGDMAAASVRQVSSMQFGGTAKQFRVAQDGRIWTFGAASGAGIAFNGSTFLTLPQYLFFGSVQALKTDRIGVAYFMTPLDSTTLLWLFKDGVWTKHVFPANLLSEPLGFATTIGEALIDPGLGLVLGPTMTNLVQNSILTFSDNNSGGPKFYSLSVIDRPGTETVVSGASPEKAGDNSTAQVSGSVTFPEWHSPAGEDAQVRTVTVDFRAWNTGGSLTNHFDITATALRLYDTDGTLASATQSYDEAGSLASSGGTLERRVFSFGDQGLGNGFQLSLANVRGVSIRRIQVVVETSPYRAAS